MGKLFGTDGIGGKAGEYPITGRNMGTHYETSAVGDRYVMEKMMATGAVLGG
jgi:hypothetical protein